MAFATPEAKIEAALLGRLAALTLTPAIAVAWPGQTFPAAGQTKPDNYLRVEHGAVAKTRPFLSTTSRQRGNLFVSACLKLGTSTTAATDIAGKIADHFPADHEETVEGVSIRITQRPEVQGGYRDETDQRWRVPVVIEYEAWLQAS
jgi:hypothetical protein